VSDELAWMLHPADVFPEVWQRVAAQTIPCRREKVLRPDTQSKWFLVDPGRVVV